MILLATTVLAVQATAANPIHTWSDIYGDTGDQVGAKVAIDPAGASIAASHFQDSIDFGGGALTSAGGWDIYLAKLDASGSHIWSQKFGSTGDQFLTGMAVDVVGNIFLVGVFSGSIDFGGGVLTSAGDIDFFIAKIRFDGVHQWSMRFGDGVRQRFRTNPSVAVDGIGDVIMAGELNGTADFGGGPLVGNAANVEGRAFLAKFNSLGSHSWSKVFGGASNTTSEAWTVTTDSFANIIIGATSFATDFGGGELAGFLIVLAKFNKSGGHIWSQGYARPSVSHPTAITVDAHDRIVMGGTFSGSMNLGGGALSGNSAVFIARYDNTFGTHLMSRAYGTGTDLNPDQLNGLATDAAGNIIICGFAQNNDWGGSGVPFCGGACSAILACYDSTGTHQWSNRFPSNSAGTVVDVNVRGSDLMIGGFINAGGWISLGGDTLTSAGSHDAFVGRFGGVTVDVPEPGASGRLSLAGGFPNPFGGTTSIRFGLSAASDVQLSLYDVRGRLVRTLLDEFQMAGRASVPWDGRDGAGRLLPSGVYLIRLESAGEVLTRSVNLLR